MNFFHSCFVGSDSTCFSRVLLIRVPCCDWPNRSKDASTARTEASHWRPAPRKKPTGCCSTALDPSSCTTELTMTVGVASRMWDPQCDPKEVTMLPLICPTSLPPSQEGSGRWRVGFRRLLLHSRQPQHLQPVGQLHADGELWRGGARAGHEAPGPLRLAVRPRRPLHRHRPGRAWHHTQQFTVFAGPSHLLCFRL